MTDATPRRGSVAITGINKDRVCTDRFALVLFGCYFLILMSFTGYCMAYGDPYRVFNGYDDCGNVCGKANAKDPKFACHGEDMTARKYLMLSNHTGSLTKECVETCDTSDKAYRILFLNRCTKESQLNEEKGRAKNMTNFSNITSILTKNKFFDKVLADLQMCWMQIVVLSILTIVFSVIFYLLLKTYTKCTVYALLFLSGVVAYPLTGYFWYKFATEKDKDMLVLGILATIGSVILLCVTVFLWARIKLVIQLYKEAAKAMSDIPAVIFQPFLTFIFLSIITCIFMYISFWIMSSGHLTKKSDKEEALEYVPNNLMITTRWFGIFAIFWIIQFAFGCQHIIIAGCIAAWYFSRNKKSLNSPLRTSTSTVMKYHMGTVAFGSLIIALLQFIRLLIQALSNDNNSGSGETQSPDFSASCSNWTLDMIESIVKYLSKNAYIETAIYGDPFCTAGKRAFKLITDNIFNVIVVNTIGDWILGVAKGFIIMTIVLIGYLMIYNLPGLNYIWIHLVIYALISYFIIHCFFAVFEMTVNTLFLCFCEDCAHNDGKTRPYFMSAELAHFIEDSNRVLDTKWDESKQQAWRNGPGSLVPRTA